MIILIGMQKRPALKLLQSQMQLLYRLTFNQQLKNIGNVLDIGENFKRLLRCSYMVGVQRTVDHLLKICRFDLILSIWLKIGSMETMTVEMKLFVVILMAILQKTHQCITSCYQFQLLNSMMLIRLIFVTLTEYSITLQVTLSLIQQIFANN